MNRGLSNKVEGKNWHLWSCITPHMCYGIHTKQHTWTCTHTCTNNTHTQGAFRGKALYKRWQALLKFTWVYIFLHSKVLKTYVSHQLCDDACWIAITITITPGCSQVPATAVPTIENSSLEGGIPFLVTSRRPGFINTCNWRLEANGGDHWSL